ncbi:MAG: DUF748 domain-containing protein [Desulfobacterales bacterium]
MGWKLKILIAAVVLIVLYTLSGFLVMPLVAESVLPDKLEEHLQRPAEVENVSFNPYTLALSVEGLEISEKDGGESFVSFDRFFVNLQWSSLFRLSPVSSELKLDNPGIRISRVSETEFNFSDLVPGAEEDRDAGAGKEKDGGPLRFSFSNIEVSEGSFVFRDEPMDKTHRFTGISFKLPVLSNFEADIDDYAEPLLAGEVNDTELRVDASTKPFADSLETIVDVSLTGISLPRYFDYFPGTPGFSVTGGSLDVESSISFMQGREGESRIEVSGTADFSDLEIIDSESEEMLAVPSMHLKMAPSSPLEGKIRLDSLVMTEPEVTLVRRAGGGLNYANIGLLAEEAGNGDKSAKSGSGENENKESSPFIFELGSFRIDSGSIDFRDFAAPAASAGPQGGPVESRMEAIDLQVSDFSNSEDHRSDLDFSATLAPDASLSVGGNFSVSPLSADMGIKIDNLGLSLAQSYFPDSLNLVLSEGSLGLSGNAGFSAGQDEAVAARFTGKAGISDLTLIEENTGRDLTDLDSFDLSGIDASWNPAGLNVGEVSVAGLKQEVVVRDNKELNLSNIYNKENHGRDGQDAAGSKQEQTGEKETGDGGGVSFPVSIGEVKLSDILAVFTDNSISSTHHSRISLSGGSIKGLSTEAFDGAEVSMKGAVDEHAPFEISGRINPLLENLLLDLDFDLQDLELSSFSSYSGKYIGRAIEKGKLNLDLEYMVENRELESQNRLLLDQFSLGRQVKSDSAVNLPVGLAVALLKDRKGKINLDLPVSGRLDDPQFSLTGIIFRSLKNIVYKAAASPFSLVSSIVGGGGEELRYIEFSEGSSGLTDRALEKLDSIRTLLYERPEVNLELTGYVNRQKDSDALKSMEFARKLFAAELSAGAPDEKSGETGLSRDDYRRHLERVYEKQVLSARDGDQDAKPLSDETLTAREMKEKILQGIEIDDSQLRFLAQKRMQKVKSFILEDERIEGDRVFFRKAENLSAPESKEFSSARVELDLS